ncbi:MAG TPA: condensation domain-containing protein, partial [Thermoanaerobaculia bacterium]|nr:condensation domain-containing protein [Thermoanaerobaculia bacterium]
MHEQEIILDDRLTAAGIADEGEIFAFPLSFAQRRLWFLDQLEGPNAAYNMAAAVRLSGRLDAAALERSLEEIARRHETLRTTFPTVDGEPVQAVVPAPPPGDLGLPRIDLAGVADAAGEALRRIAEEARRPFDLVRGPLWRALLLAFGPGEHILFFNLHHIVCDGWSIGVLVREVTLLYGAFSQGHASPLPELPIQYADFSLWQQEWLAGEVLESQLAYWRAQLAGAPPALPLPTDRPPVERATRRGAREEVRLARRLSASLHDLAASAQATPFMLLLAAFTALLNRYTGQEDLTVGTPTANRHPEETAGLIGFFVNALALRTDLSGDPPFLDLLARVQVVTLEAYAHQDVPFDRVVEALAPERSAAGTPFFQVMLVLQNAPGGDLTLPGLDLAYLNVEAGAVKLDLTLNATESPEGLILSLEYDRDLFDPPTSRRWGDHFETLLQGIAAAPRHRLSELPLLSDAERHQLLAEWNDTAPPAGLFAAVHELVFRQAERDAAAPALLFEGEAVSYGELRRRAEGMAALLRAAGIGQDDRVALCAEPSPALIAGLLGILAVGGAYVPLDPTHPPERLARMLADSGVRAILADELLRPLFAAGGVRLLPLAPPLPDALADGLSAGCLECVDPAGAAYVIYTSGSTGVPKGVVALHGGLANFTRAMAAALDLAPGDRMLQFASLTFDASAVQIFPTLTSGAALVLHRDPRRLSPAELRDFCAAAGVTVLDLPAALWRQWVAEVAVISGDVAAGTPIAAPIRSYLTGGEAVPAAVLRAWAGAVAP